MLHEGEFKIWKGWVDLKSVGSILKFLIFAHLIIFYGRDISAAPKVRNILDRE